MRHVKDVAGPRSFGRFALLGGSLEFTTSTGGGLRLLARLPEQTNQPALEETT